MTTTSLAQVRVQAYLPREEDGRVREPEGEIAQSATFPHVSVLLEEVFEQLQCKAGETVLDATAGQGGHSYKVLSSSPARVFAIDADPQAVASARQRLAPFAGRFEVVEGNFADVESLLHMHGVAHIEKAIFDLGWNLTQLTSGRGFSFLHNEELSMSYGKKPASGFTASEILNEWDEKTLADVIFGYGEEQYARRIARAIVERREEQPIATTVELAEVVNDAVPVGYRRGRLHPATKTFQALRIAVNDELGVIDRGVRGAWKYLSPGGRIAVISFHSIEDRVVKRLFIELANEGGTLITKKPLAPTSSEIAANPRSRSAKLRVIEKI